MYLTPKRIEKQLQRADKLMRILWRLYSPYRKHRKLIVEASYNILKAHDALEELAEIVKRDYKEEMEHPLKNKSIPPGYLNKKENGEIK